MKELYTIDFLLDRLFEKLESDKKDSKKFTSKKPKIVIQNRKTIITNFAELCNIFNRDMNTVKSYIDNELKVTSSIFGDENDMLQINNIYKPSHIEEVLMKYIKTHVVCSEPKCCSGNTEIIREDRLVFLKCNSCHSKKSI
eukprot:Pompholyxophrys_punicea_v1_NODE_1896_length_516_cov_1.253796.p1 type:complete len:141 gc:universal NODE_1896_length_516_cov_1.253796:37-459(+)